MPIFSIQAPTANAIKMAYNPIQVNVATSGVIPVMYVDIYFNGTYYKTISSTAPDQILAGLGFWQFDIKDAAQEYLRSVPPTFIQPFPEAVNNGLATCFTRIRLSSVVNGYVVPDTPIPVQATMTTAAAAGGGTATPTFTVLNGALQNGQQPDPYTFLSSNLYVYRGDFLAFNLFTNPRMEVNKNDYLALPIYLPNNAFSGGVATFQTLYIQIETDDGNEYFFTQMVQGFNTNSIYYLPAGPKSLSSYTPTSGSGVIDWSKVNWYYLDIVTGWGNPQIYSSPKIYVKRSVCKDRKRFRFVNWLGHFESINFDEHQEEFNVTSGSWQKFNIGNFTGAGREQFGRMRYNVRSNETLTVTGYFEERDMPFLKQFLSTPIAYMETAGIGGAGPSFQSDYMTPVVVEDAKAITRKVEERYVYIITLQISMANEKINIRN